jgi:6-pyruvoyltetrahydropterin/6-carboxytetrahydropterin synthase|tara:strand:+ start:1186 stop:1701 length:516 start_codon:yes stop_codon:yes gene_type:complete
MAKFYSTKTYGTDRGLSCCFRQWRATHSHCSTLHGYSIGIKLVFESETLDDKNWAMDFGGLKEFKSWADYMFDHTLIIAKDDPMLSFFKQMNDVVNMGSKDPSSSIPYERGAICDLRIVEGVGCEMFAKLCYDKMSELIISGEMRYTINPNVRIKSAEVFEHAGNSAIYEG